MTEPRRLTAEEIQTIARLMWGSRFSGGSEELADFLGINHRSANRLLSGEMTANEGISRELIEEFRRWLSRSPSSGAVLIREAWEPIRIPAG